AFSQAFCHTMQPFGAFSKRSARVSEERGVAPFHPLQRLALGKRGVGLQGNAGGRIYGLHHDLVPFESREFIIIVGEDCTSRTIKKQFWHCPCLSLNMTQPSPTPPEPKPSPDSPMKVPPHVPTPPPDLPGVTPGPRAPVDDPRPTPKPAR